MSKVMISLQEEFLRDLDTLARAEHRSRSELVREAVRTYVVTRVGPGSTRRADARRAAARILSTHLRFPAGETAESVVRRLRDTRYGAAWKSSSSTPR